MRQRPWGKGPNAKRWRANEVVEIRDLARKVMEGPKSPPPFFTVIYRLNLRAQTFKNTFIANQTLISLQILTCKFDCGPVKLTELLPAKVGL